MPAREVELCNRALSLLGARQISTLAGDSAEQLTMARIYPMIVEDLVSKYRWRHSAKQIQLQRVTTDGDQPLANWSACYQLAANVQNVYAVTVNDEPIAFDRFGAHVYCDAGETDVVIAEVMFAASEGTWPAYFERLVVLALAADAAIPLTEDLEKANIYEGKALRQFSLAKTTDAQQRTARKIPVGGLRRYHGGRA